MPQLSRRQNYLAPMMGLMNRQVCHEMKSVRGDVTPWDVHAQLTRVFEAGAQKVNDRLIAESESFQQLSAGDPTAIDAFRRLHAVLFPDHLDPHASGVVDMSEEHAECSVGHSGEFLVPELVREVFDEKLRHTVARFPGGYQIHVLVFGHRVC